MEQRYVFYLDDENIKVYHGITEGVDEFSFQPHYHDRYELLLFLKGDVSYTVEGRSYKLKRGDIVLSRPRQIHCISPSADTYYERYVAIINQKYINNSIIDRLKGGQDIFTSRDNEALFELFSKLDEYSKRFSAEEFSHIAYNIIEEIIYNLSTMKEGEASSDINPIIERALDYINENLTSISGIDEICQKLYITKSHLHHLFVRYLQTTPAKYISAKKLILAQRMIKKGRRPTDVYIECGFSDYATFFRNFKKHFGYSPNQEGKVRKNVEIYI